MSEFLIFEKIADKMIIKLFKLNKIHGLEIAHLLVKQKLVGKLNYFKNDYLHLLRLSWFLQFHLTLKQK